MQPSDPKIALFEKIFYDTKDKLFGFIKSILHDESRVQDCMQQCYLKLWEGIEKIDTEKDILPLLFTYSRNITIDSLRKNAKYVWVDDLSIYSEQIGFENNTEVYLKDKDNSNVVNDILKVLPPKRREVFTLIKLKGLSYKEVAQRMNISINTVEKHMEKATKVLNVEYLVKLTIIGIITRGMS